MPSQTPTPPIMAPTRPAGPDVNAAEPPASVSAESLTTETDDLLQLAKNLGPVVLLIVVIVIGIGIKRRAKAR